MSLFDLTDKVAVVTGSTRGIGKAIALEMATPVSYTHLTLPTNREV